MSEFAVNVGRQGPPTTVLPAESATIMDAIAALPLLDAKDPQSRAAAAVIAGRAPRSLFAWAELGDRSSEPVDRYMAYRVGYHRGLDTLRQSGWRGSGYVPWSEPTNRGFLRCLSGLADAAAAIGELDEADRCRQFVGQLDPYGLGAPGVSAASLIAEARTASNQEPSS